MSRPSSYWLIRLAVAIAIPAIPCFAYYSFAYVENTGVFLKLLVVLAAPLALIAGMGLIGALLEPNSSQRRLWLAAITLVMVAVFLFWIRM